MKNNVKTIIILWYNRINKRVYTTSIAINSG